MDPIELVIWLSNLLAIIMSVATVAYKLDKKLNNLDNRISRLEESFQSSVRALTSAVSESQRVIIEFLGIKGLLERRESEYLSKRVDGIFRIYASAFAGKSAVKGGTEVCTGLFIGSVKECG